TYSWLEHFDDDLEVLALEDRFETPGGYERVDVDNESFGAFLRRLPLRTDRTTVRAYDGTLLDSPSAAVVALDIGERDLQECADSAIRLHAEFLWLRDRRDELGYHFTSGDLSRWEDWQNGERYEISGADVRRVERSEVEPTRAHFREWLDTIFQYAGTRSLQHDTDPVEGQIRPGDLYVAPGSPGHAVIVLDVAENEAGDQIALLGQGFMPAQEFHVIRAPGLAAHNDVWFELPDSNKSHLNTPSWQPFDGDQARRFHQ
ncbi:MAG: DUF4846 domain-containing protein, partial [Persicimonas sp.]